MPDQTQCIPQSTVTGFPGPEDRSAGPPLEPRTVPPRRPDADLQIALRETLLWRFSNPEVAPALRVAGDALFDLLNEAGEWGPEGDGPSPQATYGEVGAACEDLGHLARYLEEVAEERHGCELDGVSEALAGEASGWAERLDALVTEIRRSLGRAEASAPAEDEDPDPGSS